ncbi:alcohol dehydrogenase [Gordonibacter sp.]|uniref:alcohol dehydrogenase n=1 Tax=Gordonibacter sp. TaxID=1968902 RepID=UPI002FC5D915
MAFTMSVISREKIALVVFAGLIVLSLLGFGWYLLAGHSWNVAASNIDDTFGSMEGYTAIVYPGTKPPAEKTADAADSESLVGSNAAGALPGKTGASESAGSGAASASGTGVAGTAAGAGSTPLGDEADAEDGSGTPEGTAASSDGDEQATASKEGTLGSSSKKEPLTVDEAKENYESKNATVFALDTADLERYSEGTILKKGGHRFGVFSVTGPVSSIVLDKQIAYFKRHKVDFIVAITPDKSYFEGASGLDIVICTGDEGLFVMGETQNGTFYVDTPELDRVGAILISPSNVVSAKVLESS